MYETYSMAKAVFLINAGHSLKEKEAKKKKTRGVVNKKWQ